MTDKRTCEHSGVEFDCFKCGEQNIDAGHKCGFESELISAAESGKHSDGVTDRCPECFKAGARWGYERGLQCKQNPYPGNLAEARTLLSRMAEVVKLSAHTNDYTALGMMAREVLEEYHKNAFAEGEK